MYEAINANGALLKKINPLNYFDQFISEGVYSDGRDIVNFRPISIQQHVNSKVHGSAYVQQGGASVSCMVTVSVAPDSDEPPIVYDFKSLDCIPSNLVSETRLQLDRILQKDYLIDIESLKISKIQDTFELRYTLHLEIMAINTNGFLTDAVLTAVQAALLDTRLPGVSYTGKAMLKDDSPELDDIPLQFEISKIIVLPEKECPYKKLLLKDFLVHTSFLLYNGPKSTEKSQCKILCDPTAELCELIFDRCDTIIGKNGQLYAFSFNMATPLKDETLDGIMAIAKHRHKTIFDAIEASQRRKAFV